MHAAARLIPGLFAAALVFAAMPHAVAADSLLDRARAAVREAGKNLDDAAKDAGRSVRDLLTDNPDLSRDIVDFGKRTGVPGFEAPNPDLGAGVTVTPAEGLPGGKLALSATGLPGSAAVVVSAGAPGAAVTVLAHATTTDRGSLDLAVDVPAAAKAGTRLVFAVETADGRVRVASVPFLVMADAASAVKVTVTGTLSKEGAECPALRGDDGKLYTLSPRDLGAFGPGDRVTVEGTVAEMSTCMQGTTIVVAAIKAAG